MIKALNDFMFRSPLRYVAIVRSMVAIGTCGSRDIILLVCHVISQDHVIKGSFDYRLKPMKVSYQISKFGGHSYCGSRVMMLFVCHVTFQDHVIKVL